MTPRKGIPFSTFPTVLDPEILAYLSFIDLNHCAEAKDEDDLHVAKPATDVLQKHYPHFVNLKDEHAKQNYPALIKNLKERVLPLLGFPTLPQISENKEGYDALCHANSYKLGRLIELEFYTQKVASMALVDEMFVRDCIFHFCQNNAENAGKLLNKHIWRFWHNDISEYLIEYGADVNAKFSEEKSSTLYQAVRWCAAPTTIRHLIDHKADYASCANKINDVTYSVMMLAALEHDKEGVRVLIEKFPKEVQPALDTFKQMLEDYADNKFLLDTKDGWRIIGGKEQLFYTFDEIKNARILVTEVMDELNRKSPLLSQSLFSQGNGQNYLNSLQDVNDEYKRNTCG